MKAAVSELRREAEKKEASFVMTHNGKKSSSDHVSYYEVKLVKLGTKEASILGSWGL